MPKPNRLGGLPGAGAGRTPNCRNVCELTSSTLASIRTSDPGRFSGLDVDCANTVHVEVVKTTLIRHRPIADLGIIRYSYRRVSMGLIWLGLRAGVQTANRATQPNTTGTKIKTADRTVNIKKKFCDKPR